MTTYFDFTPSTTAPFQFQPTLDGNPYNVVITWNLFGQRYYVNIYDLSGNLVVCRALVGSPPSVQVETLSWDIDTARVTVTTATPHGINVGYTAQLTLAGCTPNGYNGQFDCLSTGPDTLTYPLATDPGAATAFGSVAFNLSLTSGYFDSTLVYRQANQQFEVAP